MQAWNGLKGTTDIEQYVSILDQIQPADIPKGVFDMPIVAPKFLCAFLQSLLVLIAVGHILNTRNVCYIVYL